MASAKKTKKELLDCIPSYVSVPPFITAEELNIIITKHKNNPKKSWEVLIQETILGERHSSDYWKSTAFKEAFEKK